MKNQTGFSLLEVLVASSLLALVIGTLSTMMLTSHGVAARSGQMTTAVELGQQRVEWCRQQGYGALSAGTTTETLATPYEGYARTTVIAADTPVADIVQVTVTTTTPSGRSVHVVALVTD